MERRWEVRDRIDADHKEEDIAPGKPIAKQDQDRSPQ